MKVIQFNVSVPQFMALKSVGLINKAAFYKGPLATVQLGYLLDPEIPSPEWVKIKVLRCGVCASDINTIFLNNSPQWTACTSFPSVLGHEICGEVVELGAQVKNVSIGDIVAVCPTLNCKSRGIDPVCPACQKGLACCDNFARGSLSPGMGMDVCSSTFGGYGEFTIAHKSQLFKIPKSISVDAGAMIEPFAIALESVLANRPLKGERVMVIGGGVIGNLVIQSIRALCSGCKITAINNSRFTADLSKSAGADFAIMERDAIAESIEITGGTVCKPLIGPEILMGGYDRIYDCFSTSRSVDLAMRSVRTGGTVSLIGVSNKIIMDPTLMWLKLITLKGTLYYGIHDWNNRKKHVFEIAIELAANKRVKLEPLITHKLPLDEYVQMIEINLDKGKHQAIKTMYLCDTD